MSEALEEQNENTILAEKTEKISDDTLGIDEPEEPPKTKKPKGRPKKPIDKEEEDFKRRVAEETEKAYREVIESKVKTNIKKELRNKALEDGEKFKNPEPKEERVKKVLSEKQIESLAKGREIAKQKTKAIKEVYKTIDDEVKTIKEAKKKIRKTLLVDRIREEVEGLDSDEDEELVIKKKPKVKKIVKYEEDEEVVQPKEIVKPSPKIQWF
ncbi:MAG: hypothetical protein RLZZ354_520 [Pseudomonadota bacterium]|jgi:hypothetical protein